MKITTEDPNKELYEATREYIYKAEQKERENRPEPVVEVFDDGDIIIVITS
jgi:hypothetical protein